jgi:rubrerythrin
MRRLAHQAKTKSVYGEFEDTSKYYHCWNCGFICNKERNTLSDRSGVRALGIYLTTEDNEKSRFEDGSEIYLEDSYEVVIGCPFCGTGSYKK